MLRHLINIVVVTVSAILIFAVVYGLGIVFLGGLL